MKKITQLMDITQITRPSEILFEQLKELTELTELTQITTWSRGDGPRGPDITELGG